MSSGSATACTPTLSRRIGRRRRRCAGKDNAGIQDAQRVEGALGPGEQRHDLVAVDAGEQSRAEPAVAVLAGRRAAEPDERVGDRLEQRRHRLLPPRPPDLGEQVHVDVAIAGVAEDHHREAALGRRVAHGTHVLAHALDRHAAVLDHLQRPARSRGARRGSGSPRAAAPRAARPRPR